MCLSGLNGLLFLNDLGSNRHRYVLIIQSHALSSLVTILIIFIHCICRFFPIRLSLQLPRLLAIHLRRDRLLNILLVHLCRHLGLCVFA